MPTLAVRKVDHGFTEYKITADAARSKTWWIIGSIVVFAVSILSPRYQLDYILI